MRRVVVTGATGTIGTALCAALLHRGDQVTALSRTAERAWAVLGDRVPLFVMEDSRVTGPVNLTSPDPVTNAEFSRALGRALHRPAVLPAPAFALRLLYGDMAEIVTTGQRVVPRRLRELGFEFRHPAIEPALRDVLSAN